MLINAATGQGTGLVLADHVSNAWAAKTRTVLFRPAEPSGASVLGAFLSLGAIRLALEACSRRRAVERRGVRVALPLPVLRK